MRSTILSVPLFSLVLASCGGGGGGGGQTPPLQVGSLRVAWEYDLEELHALWFDYPEFFAGVTDFFVDVRDQAGILRASIVVQQTFDTFDVTALGYIEGGWLFEGLPGGNYTVSFVAGALLEADIEFRNGFGQAGLFSLDLPQSYSVTVRPGQESEVFDAFTPFYQGISS
ncbi:MAG: hypothetical protein U1F60_05675 [Planctomycetota bacterium]